MFNLFFYDYYFFSLSRLDVNTEIVNTKTILLLGVSTITKTITLQELLQNLWSSTINTVHASFPVIISANPLLYRKLCLELMYCSSISLDDAFKTLSNNNSQPVKMDHYLNRQMFNKHEPIALRAVTVQYYWMFVLNVCLLIIHLSCCKIGFKFSHASLHIQIYVHRIILNIIFNKLTHI